MRFRDAMSTGLLVLCLALPLAGCLGQSGLPPACAEPHHCLCTTDFSNRIRGTITHTDGTNVVVRVDELPEGGWRNPVGSTFPTEPLAVGTSIGGSLIGGCTTPVTHEVGTEVVVFDYHRGAQDNSACPEYDACSEACGADVACDEACVESTAEACSAYASEAWLDGFLRIAIESDGVLDFGSEPTAPARIPLSEIDSLGDLAACDARFPPPPSRCLDRR